MQIIDGKKIAQQERESLQKKVAALSSQKKRVPGLCTILVGDDAASQVYIRNKQKAVESCGMYNVHYQLSHTCSEEELLELIEKANQDQAIDGILVQLPLPKHINEKKVIYAIDPLKDVDGFHPENVGLLSIGTPRFVACTPKGVLRLLENINYDLTGKNAVVVGRSNIVGKPMAQLLLNKNATVTICHKDTQDLAFHTKQADVLVTAVGKPNLITKQHVKREAVILDVGINKLPNGKLTGDIDFDDVKNHVQAITPVPGGVGPMTIAMLLDNTFLAYQIHEGILST